MRWNEQIDGGTNTLNSCRIVNKSYYIVLKLPINEISFFRQIKVPKKHYNIILICDVSYIRYPQRYVMGHGV